MLNKPTVPAGWTVRLPACRGDGWRVEDATGTERGRFADPNIMAAHVAMLMEREDQLEAEVARLRARLAELETPPLFREPVAHEQTQGAA